jgi:uncharacterized integral membrane protein
MKIISWLLSLFFILLTVAFALHNRQGVTISFWPFAEEQVAPLYLLVLGALFIGLIVGGVIGWISHVPHRLAARRLRKDVAGLHRRIEDLRVTPPSSAVVPPSMEQLPFRDSSLHAHSGGPTLEGAQARRASKFNWRFWESL